jgi:hypothetical protein
VKTANPSAVTIDLGGVLIQRGLADGEYASGDWVTDAVSSVVGTDGEVAVTVTADKRYEFTIKLLETSDMNSALSQFYNLVLRGGGLGFFPFLYRDADTGETLTATDACVMRAPAISKDRGAKAREWKILLCNAEYAYT